MSKTGQQMIMSRKNFDAAATAQLEIEAAKMLAAAETRADIAAEEYKKKIEGAPVIRIEFKPAFDRVIVKMDIRKHTVEEGSKLIAVDASGKGYKVISSGWIVAVGDGLLNPGVGFMGSKFEVGQYVSVNVRGDSTERVELPLSNQPEEHYFAFREADIVGVLPGPAAEYSGTEFSPWFNDRLVKPGGF